MNTKTLMYILKRILLAILTVWVVITVTFFVMRAVPGGPFLGEKAITPAAQAALEAKYGMDKPLMVQYFTYLKDIVTKLDFGPSLKLRGRDVIDVIADGMAVSALLESNGYEILERSKDYSDIERAVLARYTRKDDEENGN